MAIPEQRQGAVHGLDEYLARFRSEDPELVRPVHEHERGRWRHAAGKARVYYLLKDLIPPGVFELAVDRGYHGVRAAAGRNRDRILPDFLVVGAAKCGTTSLFDWLCENPYVARPMTDGTARKELRFFDYLFHMRTGWYRSHFPLERDRSEFERSHGRPFLTGEATASYLTYYCVPPRVQKLLPRVKLIAILRNPVDRAYSAFQMSRRERLERSDTFETAIALEARRLAPEEQNMRSNPRYRPPTPAPLGYWSYLQRGRYVEHLERWFEFFPREQFLVLRFEDLVAEPQRTLDSVYEFLGIPSHQHAEFPPLRAGSYEAMSPETRAHLSAYFRPYNERLRELTGIDFGWDG